MSSVENGLPALPSQNGATQSAAVCSPVSGEGSPPDAGVVTAADASEAPGFTRQQSCRSGSQSPAGHAGAWRTSKPQLCRHGDPPQRPDSVCTVSAAVDWPGTGVTRERGRTGHELDCPRTCGNLLLAAAMVLFSPLIAVGVCVHDLIVCNDHEDLYT